MTGTVPPRLLGPRMAVWGLFPFDDRLVDAAGTRATWAWAMAQWDRVAQAGHAVRLVVVDQPYSRLEAGSNQHSQARERLAACRAADQLVFGRVYVAGGKLPLGQPGQSFDDPLRPGHQVPGVTDQLRAWNSLHGGNLDGIFLDAGPVECTDPAVPGSDTAIPQNYGVYVSWVRQYGYRVFLHAARHPDGQGWLRGLGVDFVQLWDAGVAPYSTRFEAKDPCRPEQTGVLPAWWDPGPTDRWSRVHVVNDCRDSATMRKVAELAIDKRGSRTVWITRPRQDATLGTVYDVLPPYWDDEVAFFRRFAEQEEREEKDAKDYKDDVDHTKNAKDAKDSKDQKDQQDSKDEKDNKDGKDDPDAIIKDNKDTKDDKDSKDKEYVKEDTKDDPEVTPKQEKDGKDFKDDGDKPAEFVKDSEQAVKNIEFAAFRQVTDFATTAAPEDDAPPPVGRTFIRPAERPVVGERIVADPDDSDG